MHKVISFLLSLCLMLSICGASFAQSDPAALKPGDVMEYGFYEQDNNKTNGLEPIEWTVLDVQNEKALLLSSYGLDCKPYHEKMESVRWEDCSLRAWLNDSFFTSALTEAQQNAVILSEIDNSPEQAGRYFTYVFTKRTKDQIFLLSGAELEKYSVDIPQVEPTEYALNKKPVGEGIYLYWWLRGVTSSEINLDTMTSTAKAQAAIRKTGNVAAPVDNRNLLVRPTMWIDLNKLDEALRDMNTEKREEVLQSLPETELSDITYDFLIGYWSSRNGMHTFEMKKDYGYITTVPVVPRSGDAYDLIDGILYKFFMSDPSNKTPNLKFTKISDTEIEVYSYQTNTSYTLIKRR